MRSADAAGARQPAAGDPEAGHATVLATGVIGVLVILMVGALMVASAVIASHRARSAADLASLAAAQARPPSCAEAGRVAQLHGATLRECRVDGAHVELVAEVLPAGGAARFGPAHARARAGPEAPGLRTPGADP